MVHLSSDWWPSQLAHVPMEDPWGREYVVVAEIKRFDEAYPSARETFSALVPIAELDEVTKNLARLDQSVSTTGPHPLPHGDFVYEPEFWIEARDLPSQRYEPLVLSWSSHDRTVLLLDPGFLMTYGLMPRTLANGFVSWDDPARPVHDVVRVSPPSTYKFSAATTANILIRKDYLQDYLTLRHMALIEMYWEKRWGRIDESVEQVLGNADVEAISFADRQFQLNRDHEDRNTVVAQVWGARLVALPGALPITKDLREKGQLVWPGFAEPVTALIAARQMPSDYVYVDDAVLGDFEGRPEYRVNPTTGSVSFGTQWTISYCDRVGRNLIRVELKKLYEGVPPHAIRHWNRFAVAPLPVSALPAAHRERNIATRAKEVTYGVVTLGERLVAMGASVRLGNLKPEDFVGLRRDALDYSGWWTFPETDAISRHVPLRWSADAFLERCESLNKLIVEGLFERHLRVLLNSLGVPPAGIADLGSLKLLDTVVRMAQVANSSGLKLSKDGKQIWGRLCTEGTAPQQPVAHLFSLYDLRKLKAHRAGSRDDELRKELERFGVVPGEEAGGYGNIADRVYDALGAELTEVAAKLEATLH